MKRGALSFLVNSVNKPREHSSRSVNGLYSLLARIRSRQSEMLTNGIPSPNLFVNVDTTAPEEIDELQVAREFTWYHRCTATGLLQMNEDTNALWKGEEDDHGADEPKRDVGTPWKYDIDACTRVCACLFVNAGVKARLWPE